MTELMPGGLVDKMISIFGKLWRLGFKDKALWMTSPGATGYDARAFQS